MPGSVTVTGNSMGESVDTGAKRRWGCLAGVAALAGILWAFTTFAGGVYTLDEGRYQGVHRARLVAPYDPTPFDNRKTELRGDSVYLRWELDIPREYISDASGRNGPEARPSDLPGQVRGRYPREDTSTGRELERGGDLRLELTGIIDPNTYEIRPHPRHTDGQPGGFIVRLSNWASRPRDVPYTCRHASKRPCRSKYLCPYTIDFGSFYADANIWVGFKEDPSPACAAITEWLDEMTVRRTPVGAEWPRP